MSNQNVYVGNRVPVTVKWRDYEGRGFSQGFLDMSQIDFDFYRPDGTTFSVTATASTAALALADSGNGNINQAGRYRVHPRCTDGTYDFDLEVVTFDVKAQPV